MKDIHKLLKDIKLVVCDFDGVFTDNSVWVSQDGVESVRCNRSDGLGLRRLREAGVEGMIISTEVNPVVSARAGKLKIPCEQGVKDKALCLEQIRRERGLEWHEIAFIGNDINDRPCLEIVGLPVVVADAWDEVKPLAKWVLKRNGGKGAVREFCDAVWEVKSHGQAF
jgi:3-deoxy-D-manno-octulosonate 8-phosphate phosphatase (KDO 8-P phosphatase)